jgi:thioredoxin reductase (NADPH)
MTAMHDPAEGPPDGDAPVILLVDDDDATRAMLLSAVDGRFGHDYDVLAEPSAELAMDQLQRLRDDGRQVALLIADQWLPGEAGAAFLARSRRLHPSAQRLLMSDWGDMKTVEHTVQAMVLGEIETWVGRPLNQADEEFHIVVTTALARWAHEHERGGVVLTIVGNPYDATTVGLRDGWPGCSCRSGSSTQPRSKAWRDWTRLQWMHRSRS